MSQYVAGDRAPNIKLFDTSKQHIKSKALKVGTLLITNIWLDSERILMVSCDVVVRELAL